ncbi:TonB family protein [Flavobacterium sp. MXW15]|uniref:Protein TonB n=1 Tax=Xanthomonas chitinilytica TaxID=2989819 RepID=A0ABT3JTS0_9XANT|nr:TonB family protein [Xanthomonas sp. H13-6]MCW4454655.1 TonB family protein [Flavobacterium sp. MXW15]MCW4471894.1 TonB family protein [Xanthomonas sp. H13-6]
MSDLLAGLTATTLAGTAATALVLLLRRPVRRWLGAGAAYGLWLCVPVALLAVLLPAPVLEPTWVQPSIVLEPVTTIADAGNAGLLHGHAGSLLLSAWAAGALAMLAWLVLQQWYFRRLLGPLRRRADGTYEASSVAGLPAVMGLLRPRVLLPHGFEQRYDRQERELVLHHERIHIRRGDLHANALVAGLRCLYWFNPLFHLAARRFRFDQELACDARVVAAYPQARRSYGQAMLKTQFDGVALPMGCHWQIHHPLKERIAMLKRPTPRPAQWMASALLVAGLSATLGYAAWAAQPARPASASADAAASQDLYRIRMQLEVDGERQQFELRERAGQPFAFDTTTDAGRHWQAEFTLEPVGDSVRLSGTLSEGGKQLSRPTLLARLGTPAEIHVDSADGGSLFKLKMQAQVMDGVSATTTASAMQQEQRDGKPAISVEPYAWASGGTEADAETQAVAEYMTPPKYPAGAYEQGIGGEVVLRVEVGADGRAGDITVISARPQGVFEEDSIAAARQWTFKPAMKDGRPVASALRIPLTFEMGPASP